MITYQVNLKAKGTITQLPDSQKLFGALMYLYAEIYNDQKTSEFVKKVKDKEIHFALSNVLPKGYFPTPQDYIVENCVEIINNNKNNLDYKEKRAEIKKRNYIEEKELKEIHNKNYHEVFPYITIVERLKLHASIDSLRYDIESLDANLYSVPYQTIVKISDNDDNGVEVKDFSFYIQINKEQVEFLDFLNQIVEKNELLILGKRATQGYNIYQIMDVEEIAFPSGSNKEYYLNLGMLLPDNIDYDNSNLKLFTSLRRPFEKIGGWKKNTEDYYISYIAEGSIIKLKETLKKASKSLKTPYPEINNKSIVFGNAFLYPISLKQGS